MKFRFRYIIVLFVLLFFTSLNISYAETFNSFDSYVKILKNGDAIIHNRFDFTPTKGTELYLPIKNLSKSELVDLKAGHIEGDKFINYDFNNSWNVKATLEQKKNKFGLVKTDKGYEFCIGFGDYSRKTYYMQYRVTNFVKKLEDSDMVYWRFFNDKFSPTPKNATVRIFCDEKLNENNSKIWGFGYPGTILFKDGKIVLKSNPEFNSDNYITGLIKFNKDTFTGGEKIDKKFVFFKDKAFKGSDYDEVDKNPIISFFLWLFFMNPIFWLIIGYAVFSSFFTKPKNKIKGSFERGHFKDEYYRNIPEKEWWKLLIPLNSSYLGNETSIVRAFFLKWINEKRLIPLKTEIGLFKQEQVTLKVENIDKDFDSEVEEKLYGILKEVASDNKILESNEFIRYLGSKDNFKKYKSFIDDLSKISKKYILENGYAKNSKVKKYSEKGKDFSAVLVKYYNYLKDFTLLNEREISEITVWKNLFIYATLFDVADIVEEQLNKLSPEVLKQMEIDTRAFTQASIYSHTLSTRLSATYSVGISRASGGGGFSSSGGGSGSFGGGTGGGSR